MSNSQSKQIKIKLLVALCILLAFFANDRVILLLLRNVTFIEVTRVFLQPNILVDDRLKKFVDLSKSWRSKPELSQLTPYLMRLEAFNDRFSSSYYQNNREITFSDIDIAKNLVDLIIKQNAQGVYISDLENELPNFSVTHNSDCSKLDLSAVYVRESQIVTGQKSLIILIWKNTSNNNYVSPDILTNSWSIFQYKDFVIQIGYENNILFDGGFERTIAPRSGRLATLPNVLYRSYEPTQSLLQYEPFYSFSNIILRLDNQKVDVVGLSTYKIPLSTNLLSKKILITGRYRSSTTAEPRIGVGWDYSNKSKVLYPDYIITKPNFTWVKYAGIITIPNAALAYYYIVLNKKINTTLDVDNLGLFLIPKLCY